MVRHDLPLSKNKSKSTIDNPYFNVRQFNFHPPGIDIKFAPEHLIMGRLRIKLSQPNLAEDGFPMLHFLFGE